jgi:hypothetical protein
MAETTVAAAAAVVVVVATWAEVWVGHSTVVGGTVAGAMVEMAVAVEEDPVPVADGWTETGSNTGVARMPRRMKGLIIDSETS